MPKTRRKGCINKRGEGTYQVCVSLGRDSKGKRKYHRETVKGTKADAERRLTQLQHEFDRGNYVEPSSISVNDFLDRWLEDAVRSQVSPRTYKGYKLLLARYLRDPLGHKRLDRLQPMDMQKVYSAMLAKGLSGRTVRHAHSALHVALEQAVRWNLIFRNPASLVVLPKAQQAERRVLSPDEAQRFIQASEGTRYGLVFEFALLAGMRPEEYLALQWPDIDLNRGAAQVRRALVRLNGGWSFQPPKTRKSRRTVTLPRQLVDKLRAHRLRQNEWRLRLGGLWEGHDLVFCGEGGAPLSNAVLNRSYFRPLLKDAGLPRIRLYDLRHTCATLLLLAEENPKVVSERLGHSTVVLTLDTYSHVLPTMQEKATARLEKMLYG